MSSLWQALGRVFKPAADFQAALEKGVPVSRKDPEIVRKNREFSLSNAAAGEDGEPEAD